MTAMTGAMPDQADLQVLLRDACERHRVPGAVVGMMTDDGVVVAAHGVANVNTGEPMTADTLSQVASVTKVFTATAVMLLLEERGIPLDTSINQLVPELATLTYGVTVRRLLDHTSGVESDLWDDFGANGDAIARFTAAIPGIGSISEPGEFFSYCNTGYVALGRLVEILGGSTFDRVIDRLVIAPLGLRRSTLRLADAVQHRLALGHDLAPDGTVRASPWISIRALGPTSGMITTVPDLLMLARVHLDGGGGLLRAETVQAMQTQSSASADPWTVGPGWGARSRHLHRPRRRARCRPRWPVDRCRRVSTDGPWQAHGHRHGRCSRVCASRMAGPVLGAAGPTGHVANACARGEHRSPDRRRTLCRQLSQTQQGHEGGAP